MRYLKGTPSHGILLSSQSNFQLSAFCDSDWACCPMTRKSPSSYIIFPSSNPISWRTKKQTTLAKYSVEAEYRSMAATSCELMTWLKYLLSNLGITHHQPIHHYCHNQAA